MIFSRSAFAVWLFAALGITHAQPSNDACSAAIALTINGPEVTGTTIDAVVDTTAGCGVTKRAPEVFYTVTGNGRKMTATTCSDQTDFETGITLWSLLCSSCNRGSLADPDCPNGNGARVTWDSIAGRQYTLLVYGRQADATGTFGISVTDFPNPANDYCEQAESLVINGNEVIGSTVNATTRTTAGCGVNKQAPEVFYSVTGNGKKMTATTCSDQTQFATGLTLFSNLCFSCNQGSFVDSSCPNALGARVTWDSIAGREYTLVVYGRQADETGTFGISVTDFPNPPNDYCEQAETLVINGNEVVGSTVNATTRTTAGCGVNKQAPEVFYTVTGNGRKMTATTCSDQTQFATGLTLFSNLCFSCNQGSFVDSSCSNALGARVTWESIAGREYTLVVYGRQADETGTFGISVTDFPNPPNDYCEQAQSLAVNGDVVIGSTVNATTRTTAGCGVNKQAPEVFYTVTGNGRKMTATTCSEATEFATGLTLFSNLCFSCNQGSFLDSSCPNALGARVTWDSIAGRQYTLVVYGRQSGVTGQFGISVADFVNPPNDYCDQATPLLPNGIEVLGTTVNATTRSTAGCGVTKQAPEVFYSVTGTGGDLTATTCSDQTDFETGMTLFSRLCNTCNTGSFTDVDCGNVNGAAVTWASVADQVYTILVYGRQAGATGNFGIKVFDTDNPPAPSLPTGTPPPVTPQPVVAPTPAPQDPPTEPPTTPAPIVIPTLAPQDPPTAPPTTPAPVIIPTPAPQDPPTVPPTTPAPIVVPTPAPQDPPTEPPTTPAPVVIPTPAPQDPTTPAPIVVPSPAPQVPPTAPPTTPVPVVAPTLAPQEPPTAPPMAPAPIVVPTAAPQDPPTEPPTSPQPVVVPTPVPQDPPTEPPTDPAVLCTNVTIDFSVDADEVQLQAGTYVDTQWDKFGLVVSSNDGLGTRLFDTANPGTVDAGDPDLGSPHILCGGPGIGFGGRPGQVGENCVPLGNVLIIQEDNGNESIPDDSARGGTIEFDFTRPAVSVYEIGFLDVGVRSSVTVVHETDLGMEETTMAIPSLSHNAVQTRTIGVDNVEQVKVFFASSAAVTFISFCYNDE